MVGALALGINSGAYVAEIIRGGIMAVDEGQNEAGRSLGLNFAQTMLYIIIPQALKNVLPALANEFIVLLKETSVACYVAVNDLTKGGEIIRCITRSVFCSFVRETILSSGAFSSSTIPPSSFFSTVKISDVPHHGIPYTTN